MHLLELDDGGCDPYYSHTVYDDAEPIGMVTSGSYGHSVNKVLALAYFREALIHGQNLKVLILGDEIPARILAQAPYDPENTRLRM